MSVYSENKTITCDMGSRDGATVRALSSHQCCPGSIYLVPGLGVICGLSLLLVLVLAPRGFSPGTPVFPSPQKPTFLNSNRPFYSCGSVTRPMNGSEAAGDFVLIQSSLLFLCKCRLVNITTTQFT